MAEIVQSTFALRTELSRARAAAALEAYGYRCFFRDGELVPLVVEHDRSETRDVRKVVFETVPDAVAVIG